MKKIYLIVLLSVILLAGCQFKILGNTLFSLEKPRSSIAIFNPIDKVDFFSVLEGTKIGDIVIDRDGYFCSEEYLKEVLQVEVQR